jgi:hypothetical protein
VLIFAPVASWEASTTEGDRTLLVYIRADVEPAPMVASGTEGICTLVAADIDLSIPYVVQ